MASQRVANIAGLVGYGSAPFGYMYPVVTGGDDWDFPFNQLRLRTWRDTARYYVRGHERQRHRLADVDRNDLRTLGKCKETTQL